MVASLLIFFRESFEAFMICSIMMAYLNKIDRRDRFKDVWLGVGAAILVAVIGGAMVFHTLKNYDGSDLQSKIEGITYFIACGVLTYMTFWMKNQSRNLKQTLDEKISTAITAGSMFAIFAIAFITVGREGLETVVFLIAIAMGTNALNLWIGAVVGIVLGIFLSYSIYALGKRINLKTFFNVMGTLLMFFAAGLAADGIQAFQEIGWLPVYGRLWDLSHILNADTTFGDILHSFFGYTDNASYLQFGVYVLYILIALYFFWGWKRKKSN